MTAVASEEEEEGRKQGDGEGGREAPRLPPCYMRLRPGILMCTADWSRTDAIPASCQSLEQGSSKVQPSRQSVHAVLRLVGDSHTP